MQARAARRRAGRQLAAARRSSSASSHRAVADAIVIGGEKVDPRAASARNLLRLHRPARIHRVHRHRRARGGRGGAARLPGRDGRDRHRARRHARSLRRRRHPDLLQRSAADCRARQARGDHGARDAARASCRCASAGCKLGYDLALGIGIAQGFATLGAFGFEGRLDYSAIGSVVNLASRLSDEAQSGQILIDRRTRAALGDAADVEDVGPLALKGYAQPVPAFVLKATALAGRCGSNGLFRVEYGAKHRHNACRMRPGCVMKKA